MQNGTQTVRLPARFDARVVSQVHRELVEAAGSGAVVVDGREVELADGAAAQLLVAAALKLPRLEVLPSPALTQLLAITGVKGLVLRTEEHP